MGHGYSILREIKNVGLKPGMLIGDCGSQDFAAPQVPYVNKLLQELFNIEPIEKSGVLPARDVFQHLGFDYTCFDVDRREGTVYLDYQSLCFPREFYNYFDIMFNSGTSEHLISPISLLFFMHQATKPGGIMWHDVPVFGLANHGLNNMTPKFWKMLATYNDYEIIQARIVDTKVTLIDPSNFFHEYLSVIDGLREWPKKSGIIQIAFRKKHDFCFIPPLDIDDPSPSPHTERLMRDFLAPFEKMQSITHDEIDTAMAWRFGRPVSSALIEYQGVKYSIQAACDLAQQYRAEGHVPDAKQLLLCVATTAMKHADCWHELAKLFAADNQTLLAVIMAAHACRLAPEHEKYADTKEKLLQSIRNTRRPFFNIAIKISDLYRSLMITFLKCFPGDKKDNAILLLAVAGFLSNNHLSRYLKMVAATQQSKMSALSDALRVAALVYASY